MSSPELKGWPSPDAVASTATRQVFIAGPQDNNLFHYLGVLSDLYPRLEHATSLPRSIARMPYVNTVILLPGWEADVDTRRLAQVALWLGFGHSEHHLREVQDYDRTTPVPIKAERVADILDQGIQLTIDTSDVT